MTAQGLAIDERHAEAAYRAMADGYDCFTASTDHDAWARTIVELLAREGVDGGRMLDVACGTGRCLRAFAALGWQVDGCDLSEAMLALARESGASGSLVQADMRSLPRFGAYDAVVCLNDSVNYLLAQGELEAAMSGFARNLRPGGVLSFDVHAHAAYVAGGFYAKPRVRGDERVVVVWQGQTPQPPPQGVLGNARMIVFTANGDGSWRRADAHHHQRHHTDGAVRAAVAGAGLKLCRAYGLRPDLGVDAEVGPHHHKIQYVARLPER